MRIYSPGEDGIVDPRFFGALRDYRAAPTNAKHHAANGWSIVADASFTAPLQVVECARLQVGNLLIDGVLIYLTGNVSSTYTGDFFIDVEIERTQNRWATIGRALIRRDFMTANVYDVAQNQRVFGSDAETYIEGSEIVTSPWRKWGPRYLVDLNATSNLIEVPQAWIKVGWENTTRVFLTTGAGGSLAGTGLSKATRYYPVNRADGACGLSASQDGTAIDITGTGTGPIFATLIDPDIQFTQGGIFCANLLRRVRVTCSIPTGAVTLTASVRVQLTGRTLGDGLDL